MYFSRISLIILQIFPYETLKTTYVFVNNNFYIEMKLIQRIYQSRQVLESLCCFTDRNFESREHETKTLFCFSSYKRYILYQAYFFNFFSKLSRKKLKETQNSYNFLQKLNLHKFKNSNSRQLLRNY